MRDLFLFVIKDCVTGEYSSPKLGINDNDCIRAFVNLIANSPNKADYQLYLIGEYNTSTGIIRAYENPLFVRGGVNE